MNIDINSIPAMVSYLQGVNIVKLQYSARQSGYKFKNGPESAKQAIIDGLAMRPSTMRATIAHLQRMANNPDSFVQKQTIPNGSNPFADDLAEETHAPIPAPAPMLQGANNPDMQETIDRVMRALGVLSDRVSTVETEKRNSAQVLQAIHADTDPIKENVRGLNTAIVHIKEELQNRKPVQFVLEGVSLAPVSGQHYKFKELVFWASLDCNILLIGPASSGKTTAAIEYARMNGLELYSQPLTMDSFGVLGFVGPNGNRVETEFSRAWINGGVFLWDELSMSAPEAIGALNAALANGFASFPGLGVVKKHPQFRMIAGDNSDTGANLKYGARSLLDGASLDRFIRLDWPIDLDIEQTIAGQYTGWLACVRAIRGFIESRAIEHVGATMRAVIAGCKALQTPGYRDGHITRRMILEATCKKGALAAEWSGVEALPAVSAFLQGGI